MGCLCSPSPQERGEILVRAYTAADRARVLELNAANQPAVTAMTAEDFAYVLRCGGLYLVACNEVGEVLGYLQAFPSNAPYEGTEFRQLGRLLAEPFFYIDQVVVAREHRRRRIGRELYRILIAAARLREIHLVACEVNTDPPSLESLAFHHTLGFGSLGAGTASNGMKIVFLAGWL